MTSAKLSLQDRKDLDKFTKFLALKTVQVIVQSRLGEKVKTKSKPHSSGADWFNLSIKDLPEVMVECKKAFADQIPIIGLGTCIEISLKTVEGDTLVLETWYLEMTESCEPSVRVRYTVYNRMSLLLKSLIAVTRVTPAYKLSTCQGPDSFVICYRLFMGEPQWSSLGECHERVKVGQVVTPVGTLTMSVAYRTQLTITPQKVIHRDCPFMLKSDHFKPDASPKCPRPASHFGIHYDPRNVVEEIAAACEDCREVHPFRVVPPPPSPGKMIANGERKMRPTSGKECDNSAMCVCEKQASFSESKKVGAFATDTRKADPNDILDYYIPDAPFNSLLQPPNMSTTKGFLNVCNMNTIQKNFPNNNFIMNSLHSKNINNTNTTTTTNGHHQHDGSEELDTHSVASDAELHKSVDSNTSGPEDFVLVELKPPFAGADGTTDLGTFFRECQSAPPLLSFSDQPSLVEQVNVLGDQLAAFETNQQEFDEFVDFLCHNETSM